MLAFFSSLQSIFFCGFIMKSIVAMATLKTLTHRNPKLDGGILIPVAERELSELNSFYLPFFRKDFSLSIKLQL